MFLTVHPARDGTDRPPKGGNLRSVPYVTDGEGKGANASPFPIPIPSATSGDPARESVLVEMKNVILPRNVILKQSFEP